MSDEYPGKLRGQRLSSKDFFEGVLSVTDAPEIEYDWATGVAITQFLAGLKDGKIIAAVCNHCESTQVPPMMFCHECFNPMSGYKEIADTGIINTFSLAYINTDATRRDKPELPIVVDFDESKSARADSPSGLLHLLDENTDISKIKVGAKVKAVWKPENERVGDITDIMYFKLMED